ncbi:hypothetical protein L2218_24105, partial [Xanthomonas perforans]|uniref:hypothetical protein n=1 Tax=Xanthomonas perforans TaxID=442694 RepID=UPI001F1DCA07
MLRIAARDDSGNVAISNRALRLRANQVRIEELRSTRLRTPSERVAGAQDRHGGPSATARAGNAPSHACSQRVASKGRARHVAATAVLRIGDVHRPRPDANDPTLALPRTAR